MYDEENDVYVGLPAILNKDGAERRVYLQLTDEESKKLQNILYSLSEENFFDDKYENIKNIIDGLFKDEEYRYDYYEIYANISEIAENEPLKLNYLTANVEELKIRLQEDSQDNRLNNKYSKLIQYVKLEARRSYTDIEKRKDINGKQYKIIA